MRGTISAFIAGLWLLAGSGLAQSTDSVLVSIQYFLEGSYQSGGVMSTDLQVQGCIPLESPYDDAPISMAEIPENCVDWVLVELRASPLDTSVAFASFFLTDDGIVTDTSGSAILAIRDVAAGDYYIIIRHRNHLSVMSGTTVSLNETASGHVNFTSGSDQYYGTLACTEVENGVWAGAAGDVNGSGIISHADREGFLSINAFGYLMEDLNLSGIITYADKELIEININRAAPCHVYE